MDWTSTIIRLLRTCGIARQHGASPGSQAILHQRPALLPSSMVVWRRMWLDLAPSGCGTIICIWTQRFIARNTWAVLSRIQELVLRITFAGLRHIGEPLGRNQPGRRSLRWAPTEFTCSLR